MKASVVKLNLYNPTGQARTQTDIVISFRPPTDGSIKLSDELDFDLEHPDIGGSNNRNFLKTSGRQNAAGEQETGSRA
jgi:hypothetical protein